MRFMVAFAVSSLGIATQGYCAPNIYVEGSIIGGCPPTERFYSNGEWERLICSRLPETQSGTWSIKRDHSGSKVCTLTNKGFNQCRVLWKRSSPSRFLLTILNK